MKVLVCGGRDFQDYERVKRILDTLVITTIISGLARGADSLGCRYAHEKRLILRGFPAKWNLYGKRAGFIRNKQMLDEGKPDLVVAFPGGVGTNMMCELTIKAGINLIQG